MVKTFIELKRSIYRLETMERTDPKEFEECNGPAVVKAMIELNRLIPSDFKD